jgi:hypothetical protein
MSAFFRGITEIVPSLFRGIFSERNSIPNPNQNISLTVGQLTNVTYNFGNMEADKHLCNCGELKNITYNFGNMEADNVEHLCNCVKAHKYYL